MGLFFFFQAEDGIRDADVTGVQTCALPISSRLGSRASACRNAARARSSWPRRNWTIPSHTSALLRSAGAARAVLSRAARSRASAESRWLAASCTRAESTSWETRDWPSSAPGGASMTATSTTTDGRGMPPNRASVRRERQATALRPSQIHADHGQVPVRREDLEAPLLLAPKRVLVGKQTFQLRLGERLVRRRGGLPPEPDPIIPPPPLGAVEPGRR